MPYDPPLTMVTTGPYAYVANPFQVAKVLLLLGWGIFLQNGWVVAVSAAVFVYGVTVARWHDDGLTRRATPPAVPATTTSPPRFSCSSMIGTAPSSRPSTAWQILIPG